MTGRDKQGALPRIPALDGIRTLAVAAVFAYHAEAKWLPGGFLGVDVFFSLSGFLITSLLIRECRRSGGIDLPAFWLRRARRLLPAVVLVIAATVLVAGIAGLPQLSALRWNAISGLFYFNNWHQIFTHVSYFSEFGRPPLLRHIWSLSLEEQFYLLWPPILLVAYRSGGERRVLQVAIAIALLSALDLALHAAGGASVTRIYEGTDTRATTLLLGAIAALWWSPERMHAIANKVPAVGVEAVGVVCAATLVVLMTSLTDDTASGLWLGLLVAAVCSVGVILAATDDRGLLSYLLSRRTMVWLGERSYGIYLWHWPVIAMTRNPNALYGQSLWLTLLQAAITVALAAASYTVIERPIRKLGLRGWWEMLKLKAAVPFARTPAPRVRTPSQAVAAAGEPPPLAMDGERAAAARSAPVRTSAGWLGAARRLAPVAAAGLAGVVVIGGLGAGVFARASTPGSHFGHQPTQQQIIHVLGDGGTAPVGTRTAHDSHARTTGHGAGTDGRHDKPAPTATLDRYVAAPTMVFGDSVVLGTESSLTAALGPDTTFNAVVGRQPQDTIAAVADTIHAGALPRRVVISIGDNGLVTGQQLKYLKSILPSDEQVVILTPRVPDPWGPESATTIRQAKSWWPAMKVADWASLAGNENGWFNDGVHPDDAGIIAFVRLIRETLAQFPAPSSPPAGHSGDATK